MKKLFVCTLFVLLAVFKSAGAEEFCGPFYVDPLGDDWALGDESHPLATLEGARAAIHDRGCNVDMTGHVLVNFNPGTWEFTEEVYFDIYDGGEADNKRIKYIGSGVNETFFTGHVPASSPPPPPLPGAPIGIMIYLRGTDFVSFKNIKFDHDSDYAIWSNRHEPTGDQGAKWVEIEDCEFDGGTTGHVYFSNHWDYLRIKNNVFKNCHTWCLQLLGSSNYADGAVIEDNEFVNVLYPEDSWPWSSGAAIHSQNLKNCTIKDNVIGSGGYVAHVGINLGRPINCVIEYNVIAYTNKSTWPVVKKGDTSALYMFEAKNVEVAHNIIYDHGYPELEGSIFGIYNDCCQYTDGCPPWMELCDQSSYGNEIHDNDVSDIYSGECRMCIRNKTHNNTVYDNVGSDCGWYNDPETTTIPLIYCWEPDYVDCTISQSAVQTNMGMSFDIEWGSENASACTVTKYPPSGVPVLDWGTGTSGTRPSTPQIPGTFSWEIHCEGPREDTCSESIDHIVTAPPLECWISQSLTETDVGMSFDIEWGSENASACTVAKNPPSGVPVLDWGTGTSGTRPSTPQIPGTFSWEIHCEGLGEDTCSESIDHIVTAPPLECWISQSLTETDVGMSFDIEWGSENASACTVTKYPPSGVPVLDWGTGTSGTRPSTPQIPGPFSWEIHCEGLGEGTCSESIDHTVIDIGRCEILQGSGAPLNINESSTRDECHDECFITYAENQNRSCTWKSELLRATPTDECLITNQSGTNILHFDQDSTRFECKTECDARAQSNPNRICMWGSIRL